MATIGSLAVSLSLNNRQYLSGVNQAQRATQTFGQRARSTFASAARGTASLLGLGAAFGGVGLAATAAIQSFKALTINIAQTIDSTAKLSDQLGFAHDTLIGLRRQADLNGVSFSSVQTAIRRFSVRLGEVRAGVSTTINLFDRYGINAQELVDLPLDEAFKRVADRLATVPNVADRSAAAMALFGRAGVEMNNILRHGGRGIDEATRRAAQFGLVLRRDVAGTVETMNDEIGDLGNLFKGFATQFVGGFARGATRFAKSFTNDLPAGVNVAKALGESLGEIASLLGDVVTLVKGPLGSAFRDLAFAVEQFSSGLQTALQRARELRAAVGGAGSAGANQSNDYYWTPAGIAVVTPSSAWHSSAGAAMSQPTVGVPNLNALIAESLANLANIRPTPSSLLTAPTLTTPGSPSGMVASITSMFGASAVSPNLEGARHLEQQLAAQRDVAVHGSELSAVIARLSREFGAGADPMIRTLRGLAFAGELGTLRNELQLNARSLGANSVETVRLAAQARGLTAAQAAQIANATLWNNSVRRTGEILDGINSGPLQTFHRDLFSLQQGFRAAQINGNAIGNNQQALAFFQVGQGLLNAVGGFQTQLPQALAEGSSQAISAINAARRQRDQGDPVVQIQRAVEILQAQQERQIEIGNQIRRAVENNQIRVVGVP